ncbi:MAG TPA: hypothetical protein VN875_12115 [Candidatus Binatus sp.]|jgi:hypothetical protein|nr:hypothetical protein [Candidatus Binatus sp.]
MSRRTQIGVLLGLVILLVVVYISNRPQMPGLQGVMASDSSFQPLNVDEPELRLDLLAKLQKLDYPAGAHRDIFTNVALPPQLTAEEKRRQEHQYPTVQHPPPPPPVEVPAQFFGYASMRSSPHRLAFFLNGDEVLVVQEGSVFLGRFRLDKIGNDSADVEEVSSGRHASVPMVAPPAGTPTPGGDQPPPNP